MQVQLKGHIVVYDDNDRKIAAFPLESYDSGDCIPDNYIPQNIFTDFNHNIDNETQISGHILFMCDLKQQK